MPHQRLTSTANQARWRSSAGWFRRWLHARVGSLERSQCGTSIGGGGWSCRCRSSTGASSWRRHIHRRGGGVATALIRAGWAARQWLRSTRCSCTCLIWTGLGTSDGELSGGDGGIRSSWRQWLHHAIELGGEGKQSVAHCSSVDVVGEAGSGLSASNRSSTSDSHGGEDVIESVILRHLCSHSSMDMYLEWRWFSDTWLRGVLTIVATRTRDGGDGSALG